MHFFIVKNAYPKRNAPLPPFTGECEFFMHWNFYLFVQDNAQNYLYRMRPCCWKQSLCNLANTTDHCLINWSSRSLSWLVLSVLHRIFCFKQSIPGKLTTMNNSDIISCREKIFWKENAHLSILVRSGLLYILNRTG